MKNNNILVSPSWIRRGGFLETTEQELAQMESKAATEFTFPKLIDGSRGVLTPAVKRLYSAGVDPAEIRARAIAAGWTSAGVGAALRKAGHRDRDLRSDIGEKDPLDVSNEAERLLSHFASATATLAFLDRVRDRIATRRH